MNLKGISLGPTSSRLNHAKIETTLLLHSSNRKTGDCNHTLYLPQESIYEAIKTGSDESVCGGCELKPSKAGICYEDPRWISNVQKQEYPHIDDLSKGQKAYLDLRLKYRLTRLGSMGDPASDTRHIDMLTKHKSVGYTSQWRNKQHADLKSVCMASVHTPAGYDRANDNKWRTFRIKTEDEPLFKGEVLCPYPKKQCQDCGLCDGLKSPNKPNIAVNIHGLKHKINNYLKLRGISE
mgnify:CR=1 FL=1